MSEIISTRTEIMNLIKDKLGEHQKWSQIESQVAIQCSNLIEPTNEDLKNKLIDDINKIKQFLELKGFEELDFLSEEIKIHANTNQISLYEEKSDTISPTVIAQYARISHSREGIIGIPQKFTFEQVRKLTNGVYRKTKLVKFYISNEKQINGKIVAEIYEHPQSIPIATLVDSKKRNDDGDAEFKKIMLFGDKIDSKKYIKIKEIKVPFYVYKFISDENKETIIFSIEKMDIGDYKISGMQTECDDYKMLTASSKLATKLPFLFVQSAQSRITKFNSLEEFSTMLNKLEVSKDTLFEYLFTTKIKNKNVQLKYFNWFKKLIWAWLIHKPKGLKQLYPMHLYIAGPPSSGKSSILEIIHEKVRETGPLFSGVSSTLKKLVPSFKYMPMQHGYLAESNRFAFCDEFLRCIVNNNSSSDKEESVGMMNDLLEHKKRIAGSGVSSGTVSMTARVIAASNPVRGTNSMNDLLNNLDGSFLSRWLIYYQSEEDIELARSSDDDDLEILKYDMDDHDLVSIIDYLQDITAKFDKRKIIKIFDEPRPLLNQDIAEHYDSRQKHHIECLMDGIVKTRCLMQRDLSFEANDEDYDTFRDIWIRIVKSWIDVKEIKNIPIESRINYMPQDCQYIYKKIITEKKNLTRFDIYELVKDEISKVQCNNCLVILIDNDLLISEIGDTDNIIKPYWMR